MKSQTVPRVELVDIEKSFGGVRALRGVSLTVYPGSIHALVGENGAGKSTLIKILAGLQTPDQGIIKIDGEEVSISGPSSAMDLGIRAVYQEPELVPDLTVSENLFIGREITANGRIDWATQAERTQEILALIDFPEAKASLPVRYLTIAEQQQISIAKAVISDAKVLILDEPSAILTDSEIERLFEIVRRLKETGVSVIFITHRLDEIFEITDRITVLRDGKEITSVGTAQVNLAQVIEWMVGNVESEPRDASSILDEVVFSAKNIGFSSAGPRNSLFVRHGEIVGLYGLLGSGTFEFVESCYGMRPGFGGTITVGGKERAVESPVAAKRAGIAMVPADRAGQALFRFQSVLFNTSILNLQAVSSGGFMRLKAELKRVGDLITRLRIKTPSPYQAVSAMSGGNAQKVVMARQMMARPKVLLLAEPTQGVDIAAKEEIHQLIEELAADGVGVLVATTDLTELLRLCDRVIVFRDGQITSEFASGATQADLLGAAAGASTGAEV